MRLVGLHVDNPIAAHRPAPSGFAASASRASTVSPPFPDRIRLLAGSRETHRLPLGAGSLTLRAAFCCGSYVSLAAFSGAGCL